MARRLTAAPTHDNHIRARRRSIAALLTEFRHAVEARAIDMFWLSRKKHKLRSKPETIAQGLLSVFARAIVGDAGMVMREFASGVGFVDVGISFGATLHLVELKILTGKLTGASQLATYMAIERRTTGWLLLGDAWQQAKRTAVPSKIATTAGVIRTVCAPVEYPS